jgi:lysozyme
MTELDKHVARLEANTLFQWHRGTWRGAKLVAYSEGCELVAYLCQAGVWTIGWGETAGRTIKRGMRWTEEQADRRFNEQYNLYAERVDELVEDASPNQLGAMASLAYNIGLGGFERSSVRKLHNAGNHAGAARAFGLWNKATVNGVLVESAGLTARRAAEAALYTRPEPGQRHDRMPQAIAQESSLKASPIAQGGATNVAVAGAGGAVVALKEVGPMLEQGSGLATSLQGAVAALQGAHDALAGLLGFSPLLLVFAGAAYLAGRQIYWRWRQRQEGRA